MADKKSTAKAATKSVLFQELSEATGLTRKQVASIFDAYEAFIKREVGKKGPGVAVLPGLAKIKRVNKPPSPEKMGRNPATGEPMLIKAKPARTAVKVLALKNLKEMVK